MDGTVYLLGAGFSKAISPSMPLTRELGAAVRADLDLPAFLLDFRDDFERWLTYLAEPQPWIDERERLRNRSLFLAIIESIRDELLGAQAAAHADELPDWLHRLVGQWVKAQRILGPGSRKVVWNALPAKPSPSTRYDYRT